MASIPLRSYPVDSAHGAARIVALALVADGRMSPLETAALEAWQAAERLGLSRSQWHAVIDDLCADLLGPARSEDEGCIPTEVLDAVLDQVQDPALRRRVLRLCSAVVHADRRVDEAESFVLLAAIERWDLPADDRALLEPMLYGLDFQVRPRSVRDAGQKLRAERGMGKHAA